MTQDAEIFRSMVFSDPAMTFSERDVQTPVQAVFDAPVFSDGLGDRGCLVFEAGDEISPFRRSFPINISLTDRHTDVFDACPGVVSLEPIDGVSVVITPGFEATVLAIDGFEGVVRGNAVGQLQKLLKPGQFRAAVFSHLGPGLGAADGPAKSDEEHIGQQVTGVVMPRVFNTSKMFAQARIGRLGHGVTTLKPSVFKVVGTRNSKSLDFFIISVVYFYVRIICIIKKLLREAEATPSANAAQSIPRLLAIVLGQVLTLWTVPLMTCYYPSAFLRTLRNQIPIGDLIVHGLKMKVYCRGKRLRFRCPCCASLHTAINTETNLARCFQCRKNFNPIEMVMAAVKCTFVEAVEHLKRHYLAQ